MLKLFFCLATLLALFSAHARELVVISDLDETLRQADVENKLQAGLRLLKGVKPYVAAQILFSEIAAKNPGAKFYYLSNSFGFTYNGKKWTKKNGFPEGTVFQRKLGDKSDSFKPKKLAGIVSAHAGADFLFFGDNIERDPQFYAQVIADSQLANARVFIRDARLIFPQDGSMTYYQHEAQLLDDLDASANSAAIIKQLDFNFLVPPFLMENLRTRLVKACKEPKDVCEDQADEHLADVRTKLEVL